MRGESMLQVIIMSGVSGAGKDTWIKKFQETNPDVKTFVVSADSYFTTKDGVYNFNPSKLGEAHNACIRDFIQHVRNYIEEDGVVFVNNTNTTSEEIAPYYAIASAYGAEVELVTVYALPHIAAKRNVHGVPEKGIQAMHDRIQARKIPPFWNISCSDNLKEFAGYMGLG
tara:strand:- start:1838 stop:2347 length:510 start_codon:yes stop_codon:yes gene_type:complete